MSTPQQPSVLELKHGFVKQVVSGDMVVIRGQPKGGPPPERTLCLSNITAPKLARRPMEPSPENAEDGPRSGAPTGETKDEPFAWEAREFLRKKLVGKEVAFAVEYKVPSTSREYGVVYLGKDSTGENVTESLVEAGLVEVRRSGGNKGESFQRLCDLEDKAKSAGLGKWGTDLASHVRDVKWNVAEEPRVFVDRFQRKPVPAVVEMVRDGSTLRVLLLPSYHYVTLMLSGIRSPPIQKNSDNSLAEEAKYFTESRLLQRDVEVVLETVSNRNFLGSVLHPNGNIAELLVLNGMAKCVDWNMSAVTSGADKLRAAEKVAKDKRLRWWKDYTPAGVALDAKDSKYEGTVTEVINADALVVKTADGDMRKVFLSSIRPPRLAEENKTGGEGRDNRGRNFRPLYDIPFMYDAREFLRKKLIGKKVSVSVDYIQPASGSFQEKTCCTITIGGVNVAEALVGKGLATVVRYRQDDDQRSAHYSDLLAAEMKAQKSGRGLHCKKEASVHRVVDLSGDMAKSKQFLPFLQRAGKTEAVVEFVASGSRLRLYVPRENCLITFLLAGITCPRAGRVLSGQTLEEEPFGNEALAFTKDLCLQREVEVEVESMDKAGNFIGWLTTEGVNLSVALVQEGLASVHFTAERSTYYRALQNAEDDAKRRREKMWAGYEETDEVAPKDDKTERTVNYKTVVVTEVKPELSFYVQSYDEGAKLEQVMQQLRQELSSNPPVVGAYTPKRGDICAAKFSEDDLWYRAKVERVVSNQRVDILFIDYGNRETTDSSRLTALPVSSFRDMKPCAEEYSLACVTLPKDPEQAADARHAFMTEVQNETLQLNVEFRVGNQSFVTLVTKGTETDVAKKLLEEGYLLVESRREPRLQDLVKEYREAQESAKRQRRNLWCYGDVTEDDSKEFGF
ncbi:staphylococcal nuclease domain-containing protein 1-like [Ornithodoros turicata]|uniref:staphylococcal nuclease domain-containing protein 1-like n=1 Tax=Ornithodoros turicata TaxID=34597 RepID=UPI003139E2DE